MEQNRQGIQYAVKTFGQGISVKDVSTSDRIVTGFFNSYNWLDSDGDILLNGCAKKSITERGAQSTAVAKIKHALNHDLSQLVGKIQVLEEKELDGINGIYFETKMANTELGNDTLQNYLEGVYDNHSIGFRYMQLQMIEKFSMGVQWEQIKSSIINPQDMDQREMVFVIKEINLFEGSTVAFGSNSLTPYLGTKSTDKKTILFSLNNRMDKLVKSLSSGTQSDDMMNTFELQVAQIKQMMGEIINTPIVDEKKSQPTNNQLDISKIVAMY